MTTIKIPDWANVAAHHLLMRIITHGPMGRERHPWVEALMRQGCPGCGDPMDHPAGKEDVTCRCGVVVPVCMFSGLLSDRYHPGPGAVIGFACLYALRALRDGGPR